MSVSLNSPKKNVPIPKIGLEIHFRLKTVQKLFSSALNQSNAFPNTVASPYDWGYPGIYPIPSEESVVLSLQAAAHFSCTLAKNLLFDRKNYYYFDLPRGYQITQIREPIGSNGYLFLPQSQKKINIDFLALEEDTAQTIHDQAPKIMLDYNRSGNPLIELVTKPDFQSINEINEFLDKVFMIFNWGKISDCFFATGNVRIDLNVSSCLVNETPHPRTEIKNLNSRANLATALRVELATQASVLNDKKIPVDIVTKRFSEKDQKLFLMRKKSTVQDYNFTPEWTLLPFELPTKMLDDAVFTANKINDKILIFNQHQSKLKIIDRKFLNRHFFLQEIFYKLSEFTVPIPIIFFFFREICLTEQINFSKIKIQQIFITKILLLIPTVFSFAEAKKILFNSLVGKQIEFSLLVKESILKVKTSSSLILLIEYELKKIIAADSEIFQKYKKRPNATSRYLIGQLKRIKTKTEFPPTLCAELIDKFFNSNLF